MPNISCIEFNRLIEEAVESRSQVDSASLRAHATECAGCRATWLDAMLVDGAVAEWRKTGKKILPSVDLADIVLDRRTSTIEPVVGADITPFAPPSLTEQAADENTLHRVAASSHFTVAPTKPSRTLSVRRAVTAAIGLAVAVSVALYLNRPGQEHSEIAMSKLPVRETTERAPGPPEASRAQTSPSPRRMPESSHDQRVAATTNAAPVEEPVAAMVQGAQAAYLDWANEASHAVSGATALVPRSSLAGVMAPVRDENDRWVDDVGQQFEPVGKNLSQAFQFILEAVPAEKSPAT
jgi:hypothetical protein